jgi:hypothetical protein
LSNALCHDDDKARPYFFSQSRPSTNLTVPDELGRAHDLPENSRAPGKIVARL